jgi:hypothetical protein
MFIRSLIFVTLLATLVGCGAPGGPRVRYAHATPADLAAVEGAKTVWYEFQAGDVVPMNFVFLGIFEASTPQPVRMVAQKNVWVVVTKNKKTAFSFDGRRLVAGEEIAKWVMLMGTRGEQAGQVTTGLIVGRQNDLPPELR